MANNMNTNKKQEVSEILNITINNSWKIVDSDEEDDLQIVHYVDSSSSGKPSELYSNLRGTVVSTKYKTKVADSYGYTPVCITDRFGTSNKEITSGKIELMDVDGSLHSFDTEQTVFHRGYEGTIMRMFLWNGKVYKSIHKKLVPNNSRWGNETSTFQTMYDDLNGPETLFKEDCKFSPYCHYFLLNHPQVLICTKYPLTKGLLVYLGNHEMWKKEELIGQGVDESEIDTELKLPELTEELDESVPQPYVFEPKKLTLEEANNHLKYGFWKHSGDIDNYDDRLGTGEFIIVRDQITNKSVRIHSRAYDWRYVMRDNNPNLYCQFVRMISHSYYDIKDEDQFRRYTRSYPIMSYISKDDLKTKLDKEDKIVIFPLGKNKMNLDNQYNRYYNIWLAYMVAVPLNRQKDVLTFLDDFQKDKRDLINWLKEIEGKSLNDNEKSLLIRRVDVILQETRKYAEYRKKIGKNKTKNGLVLTTKQLIDNNIVNLVGKEHGKSLYTLIKIMKRYKKFTKK